MDIKSYYSKEWVNIYLEANFPSQVYSGFRSNQSVISLSHDAKPNELLNELDRLLSLPHPKTLEDIVSSYATLLAITLIDYSISFPLLSKIDLNRIEWGKSLLEYYYTKAKSSTIFTSTVPLIKENITKNDSNININSNYGSPSSININSQKDDSASVNINIITKTSEEENHK